MGRVHEHEHQKRRHVNAATSPMKILREGPESRLTGSVGVSPGDRRLVSAGEFVHCVQMAVVSCVCAGWIQRDCSLQSVGTHLHIILAVRTAGVDSLKRCDHRAELISIGELGKAARAAETQNEAHGGSRLNAGECFSAIEYARIHEAGRRVAARSGD